jgi:2-polyprenyl-3-methyl-5-hydroxy-6-metoxy-1,4-benzoquinol methylase
MASTAIETGRRDALADQIFRATIGAQELLHVYLGDRLGLYTALAETGSVTPAEFARSSGIAERYAREWLEQQAVSGVIDVEDTGDAETRRYRLAPGTEQVLCDPESLYYVVPLAPLLVSLALALPRVIDAFRTGGGVPYEDYPGIVDAIARVNRPMFNHQLASEWIPALPDIEARLGRSEPPARVADLGCGTGVSTLAIARAYPDACVDGIDLDRESIETATKNTAGLEDRVMFTCGSAADLDGGHRYDLITLFETLHDMSHPVEVLRSARHALAPGGAVLIGDERVGETFTAPGDDLDRFNYGWSALHCLAAALVDPDSAATGTVIRPETVRRYAHEAGFARCTVLPIEHDFWRFYRLDS